MAAQDQTRQSGAHSGFQAAEDRRSQSQILPSIIVSNTRNDHRYQVDRRQALYRYIFPLLLLIQASIAWDAVGSDLLMGIIGLAAAVTIGSWFGALYMKRWWIMPAAGLLLTIGLLLLHIVNGGSADQSWWLFPLLIGLSALLPFAGAFWLGFAVLLVVFLLRVDGLPTALRTSWLIEQLALVVTWLMSLGLVHIMRRQANELADLALVDPLTGAFNRRYLDPQLQRHLADYIRYARRSAILLIDIDHFKAINDRHGHSVGDDVLRAVVRVISGRIRSVDMIFRIGGEEFVVFLAEATSDIAVSVAEELRASIAAEKMRDGAQVTASMGICDVTAADTVENWIEQADHALYQAKMAGRNCVHAVVCDDPVATQESRTLPNWR